MKLDNLPFDVLILVFGCVGPLDVLALRQTCKAFFAVSYERDVWAHVYASSRLPRVPGPLSSQSRQTLETKITQSAVFDRRMGHGMGAKAMRKLKFKLYKTSDFQLLAGRWLVVRSKRRVFCCDLQDAERGDSRVIYNAASGYKISSLTTAETVDYGGRYHGFISLIQDRDGPYEALLSVFEVHEASQGITLSELYHHSYTHTYSPLVQMTIGPSALLVSWHNRHADSSFVVLGFDQPNPSIQTPPDLSQLGIDHCDVLLGLPTRFVLSSTHLIITRIVSDPYGDASMHTWIGAIPLRSALRGEHSMCFSGFTDHILSQVVLLQDSISTSSGLTDIRLVGLCSDKASEALAVFRLLIPPNDLPSKDITVSVDALTRVHSPRVTLQPALNGALRVACTHRERIEGSRYLCLSIISVDAQGQPQDILKTSPTVRIKSGTREDVSVTISLECMDPIAGRVCLKEDTWSKDGMGHRAIVVLDFS